MREARADRRAGTVAGSITACGQHCGGEVAASGATEQIQLDVPVTAPILTRFDIALGRCSRCGARSAVGTRARPPRRWAWRKIYPASVESRIRRIRGRADFWVVEISITYDGGAWNYGCSILEFRGDKVARETIYFGQGWEAPEWRAAWRATWKDGI
jgi:hypothetical protein